jgi:hypothetical protein
MWAPQHSGRYGEEKNTLPMPLIVPRFLGNPARILVALPTELSRLVLGEQGWMILKLILGNWFGSANLIKSVQDLGQKLVILRVP